MVLSTKEQNVSKHCGIFFNWNFKNVFQTQNLQDLRRLGKVISETATFIFLWIQRIHTYNIHIVTKLF